MPGISLRLPILFAPLREICFARKRFTQRRRETSSPLLNNYSAGGKLSEKRLLLETRFGRQHSSPTDFSARQFLRRDRSWNARHPRCR